MKGTEMTKPFYFKNTSQKTKSPRSPARSKRSLGLRIHYGMREETSRELQSNRNLLSRGEIRDFLEEGRGESKSRLFWLKGNSSPKKRENLHTSTPKSLKGRIPREETNWTKIPKTQPSWPKETDRHPRTQEGRRGRTIIWSLDNQKKLSKGSYRERKGLPNIPP